jgi:hypothetical protein
MVNRPETGSSPPGAIKGMFPFAVVVSPGSLDVLLGLVLGGSLGKAGPAVGA